MNKEKESEPINRSRKIPLQLLTTWSTPCGNETRNQRRAIFFPISRFCLTIRFDVDYILYFWSRSYVKQESGGKLVLSVSVPEMDKFSSDDPRSNFLKSFPNRIEKIIAMYRSSKERIYRGLFSFSPIKISGIPAWKEFSKLPYQNSSKFKKFWKNIIFLSFCYFTPINWYFRFRTLSVSFFLSDLQCIQKQEWKWKRLSFKDCQTVAITTYI